MLEDPWTTPEEYVYSRSVSPEAAPDRPTVIEIDFEAGDPVAIDGERLSPAAVADDGSTNSAAQMASAGSIWWKIASSA